MGKVIIYFKTKMGSTAGKDSAEISGTVYHSADNSSTGSAESIDSLYGDLNYVDIDVPVEKLQELCGRQLSPGLSGMMLAKAKKLFAILGLPLTFSSYHEEYAILELNEQYRLYINVDHWPVWMEDKTTGDFEFIHREYDIMFLALQFLICTEPYLHLMRNTMVPYGSERSREVCKWIRDTYINTDDKVAAVFDRMKNESY